MAKIRWRSKDTDELKREIQKYNRKLREMSKKGFESDLFEKSKSLKELQKEITTRGQYKDYLAHLRNLTKRGSQVQYAPAKDKGIEITQAEVDELDRLVKIVNSDRRKRAKAYEAQTGGKVKNLPKQDVVKLGLKPKQTATKKIEALSYSPSANRANFQKFIESTVTQSDRDYIDSRFQRNMSNYFENLPKKIPSIYCYEIIDRTSKIDPEEFYYLQIEYPELSYDFMYNDPLTGSEKADFILSRLSALGY